ncbi:E3 ubiquitin-protein ligase TRIM71-like [Mercenaria mercenaria]|uniref:E3 ubiquitin-protein ligase TRIM71-like n=1 Tax=Mercenaria mercenaria TaxID=6596 RepID=UPI00234EDC29|nr:E3 ubiquitin-protein ligase TRIM71-like [Mercenaria mercenaria]
MATANKVFVRKDYFYCSICLEIFNTPRTLPCLHTFCHSCLEGYIQKILDKPGKQKLFCPVCRADTKTDNLQLKYVEKWVENLPINFTLFSILNERNSTMNLKENNCDPCLREGIKVKAIVYCYDCTEKMCEECKRHHRKSKLSSNHKLIDVKDGCVEKMDLSELEYFSNLSKCPKHGSEDVKYLCKDHDQLCCSECAIVTHRKCEDLVSLADEVNGNEEKNDESDIQKRLEVVDDHAYKLIDHEKKFISDLNTKETEVKSCLKDFKVNLDDAYNKLEKRILSEMSTRKLALTKASSLQKESAERLKDDIRQSAEKLEKAHKFGTARHLFLLKREIGKDINVYEETFTGLQQQSSTTLLTIAEACPLQEAVKTVQYLFKVEETMTESRPHFMMRGRNFKDRKMTLMKEFGLQMYNEPRYCLWIENSIIIVAFYSSETIVAFNSENGSVLSSYKCSSPPTGLASLENGEFAVALPTSNKIDILKIHENQMSYVRLLVTSRSDVIAYRRWNKQLLAMSRSEGMIRKFTLEGRNAEDIKMSSISSNDIGNTCNIYFDNENHRIYISSHSSGRLHCFDASGKSVFQYGIPHPWSVITDIQGNVYVASYSNNCIQQLNREGQLLREIISVNNIQHPMATK